MVEDFTCRPKFKNRCLLEKLNQRTITKTCVSFDRWDRGQERERESKANSRNWSVLCDSVKSFLTRCAAAF